MALPKAHDVALPKAHDVALTKARRVGILHRDRKSWFELCAVLWGKQSALC